MKWFLMLVAALGVLTQVQAMPNLIVTSSQHEGGNGVRYFYSVSNWTTQDKEGRLQGLSATRLLN